MDRKHKIKVINDLLEGKPPPSYDGIVIETKEGTYLASRLGKEYTFTETEFRRNFTNQSVVLLPDRDSES